MNNKIYYPQFINQASQIIGARRSERNGSRNQSGEYSRGDRNVDLDVLGVKAEMIAEFLMSVNKRKYKASPLITDHPMIEADLLIEGGIGGKYISVDVKGMQPNAKRFTVNEKAHFKKRPDYYLFIEPHSKFAFYWWFKSEEVDEWNVEQLTYTTAYCKDKTYEEESV